jgi:hypothetical protein
MSFVGYNVVEDGWYDANEKMKFRKTVQTLVCYRILLVGFVPVFVFLMTRKAM